MRTFTVMAPVACPNCRRLTAYRVGFASLMATAPAYFWPLLFTFAVIFELAMRSSAHVDYQCQACGYSWRLR